MRKRETESQGDREKRLRRETKTNRQRRERKTERGDREKECRVEHAWERDTKVKDSLNPRHHSSAFRNYK